MREPSQLSEISSTLHQNKKSIEQQQKKTSYFKQLKPVTLSIDIDQEQYYHHHKTKRENLKKTISENNAIRNHVPPLQLLTPVQEGRAQSGASQSRSHSHASLVVLQLPCPLHPLKLCFRINWF